MVMKRFPANTSLGEDVVRLLLLLHEESSRRLQDVLIKANIINSVTRLQASSRLLQNLSRKTALVNSSLRRLQDVFKTYHSRKIGLDNKCSTCSQDMLQSRISTNRFALATRTQEIIVKVQIF